MSTIDYHELSKQVQQHVRAFFEEHKNNTFVYHNLAHTEGVATAAIQIGNHYQLNDRDFFVVHTAAWFHDLGYFTALENHEENGAQMAEQFLKDKGVDAETIQAIRNCILATKLPQNPNGLLEQIVCDADLFHLGTDGFFDRNKLMRKEASEKAGKEFTKDEWRAGTIALLQKHSYHTDYAKLLLDGKKEENLAALIKKQSVHSKDEKAKLSEVEKALNTDTPVKEKKKQKRPERGVETVFRITAGNNQKLSSQADSKAHIMIQVNSIIISVLLSVLLRKIEDYPHLIIPAIMLLTVNVVTIVFSILATRPNIPKGTFNEQDIEDKKVNLLFFGNFYKMTLEQYTGGMLKMMDDSDFLYSSLIRDVYSQGVVLGKKYKQLRFSYNVFMFGLVASVLAFVIASIIYKGK